jgi:hypothetical protein
MKSIKTMSIALAAILTIGAISASAATASEWYLQGAPLTKAEKVFSETTVTLEESGTGTALRCEKVYREGVVNPGTTGEITSILAGKGGSKQIHCSVTREGTGSYGHFCPQSGSTYIEAVGLPWHTELKTVGEKLRDVIAGNGKVAPEFDMQCEGAPKMECSAETNTSVANASVGVELATDSSSPSGNCWKFGGHLTLHYDEVLKAASGKILAVK